MDVLTVSTFNCHGLKTATNFIDKLCMSSHIIALQETWLYNNELDLVKNINAEFTGFSISSIRDDVEIQRGRPFGGLSFMWHKSLSSRINIVSFDDDRILGLLYKCNMGSILFINVYLPTNNAGNVDLYLDYIGKITSIIEESQWQNVCILGDFNAAPGTENFVELVTLSSSQNLIISDVALLPDNSYTHVNQAHLSRSWLDHCLISEGLYNAIDSVAIDYDCIQSDHLPLTTKFRLDKLPGYADDDDKIEEVIRWNFGDENKRREYIFLIEMKLLNLARIENFSFCLNNNCDCVEHKQKLIALYDRVCKILIETGKEVFGITRKKFPIVPGWSEFVEEAHTEAREAFLSWRDGGSPREGPQALYMRQTRARFKLALRWCRDHEEELRARALGESMASGSMHEFWNKIRSFNNRNSSNTPGKIEDAVGTRSILTLWKRNFEQILNTLHDEDTKKHVTDKLHNSSRVGIRITVEMIKKAVQKLSIKKAFGYDGLPGGVYKYAPNILFVLLCFLFNNFIRHRFIPDLF